MTLRVLDLFSGIGGFSLGLERSRTPDGRQGFETVAFCEIELFPPKVLAKHWPEVPQYEDVTKLTADILKRDGISVDVITGGFPCQDISTAGKQAGIGEGTRSGLWTEIVRLIVELSPSYVIVENVANLLSGPSDKRGGWFGRILGDLAECGYDAEWENIPAASVGAPHRRERVWIVAYPTELQRNGCGEHRQSSERQISKSGKRGGEKPLVDAPKVGQSGQRKPIFAFCAEAQAHRQTTGSFSSGFGSIWRVEPHVGRVANGVPSRVDRLSGLGNAVVPQIPELIGNAILASDQAHD